MLFLGVMSTLLYVHVCDNALSQFYLTEEVRSVQEKPEISLLSLHKDNWKSKGVESFVDFPINPLR